MNDFTFNLTLKDLVADSLALLQNDKIRIVFYKEEEKSEWCQKNIVLQEDNTISERDLKTLKWIKGVDKKAVVMERRDFIRNWGTEFVPLEEMAGTIEYERDCVNHHNNISKFLENYTEGKEMKKEKIHQPYNKFKGFLREKELTYSDVAKALNISTTAVLNKINGVSDFYIEEVKVLQAKYGMELSVFFHK